MKRILLFSFLIIANIAMGQGINNLIEEGVKYHDLGRYNEAISMYEKALKLDKNSAIAKYELAYTYMALERYDDAIKLLKSVVKKPNDYQKMSYVLLGTCLNLSGKSKKAIKEYKKGLKAYPKNYLLNYNLAIVYLGLEDFKNVEKHAIEAINDNNGHGSSHLLLHLIWKEQGEKVKAFIPLYFFLFVEPASSRSLEYYNTLNVMINSGVEMVDTTISINISSTVSDEFMLAEMMLGMLVAQKYAEDEEKTELENFADISGSIFDFLGDMNEGKQGFFWDFYVPFFYDMAKTENYEAFCYYISQSKFEKDVDEWLENNPDSKEKLILWIKAP